MKFTLNGQPIEDPKYGELKEIIIELDYSIVKKLPRKKKKEFKRKCRIINKWKKKR